MVFPEWSFCRPPPHPASRAPGNIPFAQLGLPGALRVGQLPAEARHDVAVLFVHLTGEAVQHLLHGGVAGAGLGGDGHRVPCVGIDAVVVRVHNDVKAPDLVGAGARLRNDHAVFLHRVLRQGVAVPADDQVHPPTPGPADGPDGGPPQSRCGSAAR